jgi:thymidylate synthase (FAD)
VSRSFTHELVRHRLFSYSQLSQRFVSETDAAFIEPDVIANDPKAHEIFVKSIEQSRQAYTQLNEILKTKFDGLQDKTLKRKKAREAARAVLPNATETKIVVTGNFRAWRHFVRLRSAEHTDVEIRAVAIAVLRQLNKLAPAIFGDFEIYKGPDGLECARTKHVFE